MIRPRRLLPIAHRGRQRLGIDLDAEPLLQTGQVLAERVVEVAASDLVDDRLERRIVGSQRRHQGVEHLEQDATAGRRSRAAGLAHRHAEDGGHRARRQRRRAAAAHIAAMLHLEVVFAGRDRGERLASVDRLHQTIGLGRQLLCDFVRAPGRLDAPAHVGEGQLPRRLDARYLEPGVAAVRRADHVRVGADVGGERRLEQGRPVDDALDRLVRLVAALRVDRVDRPGLEAGCGRRLAQGLAGGALLLDLVAQARRLCFGADDGDLVLELGGDFRQRLLLDRNDCGDMDQDAAELRLQRRADAAVGQGKSGVRHHLLGELVLRDGAECDVLWGQLALGYQRREALAGIELGLGGLRRGDVGEHDLLDAAGLRHRKAGGLLLVVALLHVRIRDGLRPHQVRRYDGKDHQLAVFGSQIGLAAVVEIFLQLGVGGLRNISGRSRWQVDIVDRPRLRLVAVDRLRQRLRHTDPANDRVRDVPAEDEVVLVAHVARLGQTVVPHQGVETRLVELPVAPLEIVVAANRLGDLRVGHSQAEGARLLVQHRIRQQAREHLTVQADTAGLVVADRAFRLLLHLLQFGLIGVAERVHAYLRGTNLRQLVGVKAAEHVADSPEAEADDDKSQDDGHDRPPDQASGRGAYSIHHGCGLVSHGRAQRAALPPLSRRAARSRQTIGRRPRRRKRRARGARAFTLLRRRC